MNNNLAKSAFSGVIGTTFMTLFSIFASEKRGRQFREPEILSMLLKDLPINKSKRIIIGWIAHYMVSVSFNMVNQKLLDKLQKSPTFLNGVLLGAVNGAVGLAIWKAIFEAHPSPPKIGLNRYLAHLFLAHLIFASLANV
ncbi:MAG TPA: hypothetical protein VHO72_09045, partial [Bacteroidales bacterium]|nr:hypothetical protein [Bacteroidales bacterium]